MEGQDGNSANVRAMETGLPLNVIKQVEEAEALYDEMYGGKKDDDQAKTAPDDGGQAQGDTATKEGDTAPGKDISGIQPSPDEEETWKARFLVLKGKYDAEIPRFARDNAELRTRNEALTTRVDELSAKVEELQRGGSTAPADDIDDTPEIKWLREEYPEIAEAMKVMLDKRMPAKAKEKEVPASTSTGSTPTPESVVLQQAALNFYDTLDTRVPNWSIVNKHPSFIKWLKNPDGFSGQTIHDSLMTAYRSLDHATAVRIFEDGEKAMRAEGFRFEDSGKKSKEKYAAPGSASDSVERGVEGQKEIIKASEIQAHYNDRARNPMAWKGREKEAAIIDDKYQLAATENRIDYTA